MHRPAAPALCSTSSSRRVHRAPLCSSSTPEAATASTSSSAADCTSEPSSSGRINPQVTTLDDDIPHECSYYDWKWGSKISFVRAGRSGPPLLLCHGFGVGSYHFDRNIPVLAQNHRVSSGQLSRQVVVVVMVGSGCGMVVGR